MKKKLATNYRVYSHIINETNGIKWTKEETIFITQLHDQTQEQINQHGLELGVVLDTLYGKEWELQEMLDDAISQHASKYFANSIGYEFLEFEVVE